MLLSEFSLSERHLSEFSMNVFVCVCGAVCVCMHECLNVGMWCGEGTDI